MLGGVERNLIKIWFAWADKLSRETVEPLYKASISVGYDCILEPRGRYDDLSKRMKPFSHFVFGVGCDTSWNKARESNTKSIFVQHGQYLLGSWRGPWPDVFFLTGEIYADDVRKSNKERIYYPGYIRADKTKQFKTNNNKNIKCLVTLPHLNEHRLSPCLDILEKLRDIDGLICRTHPRNNKAKTEVYDIGIQLDESPSFYDSLARSRCMLSGPSNCIIESCILDVPVGVLSVPGFIPSRETRYHRYMIDSYESIATLFANIDDIRDWIDHPISKNRKNAKRFWQNDDGNIDVVIDSFMEYLDSEK